MNLNELSKEELIRLVLDTQQKVEEKAAVAEGLRQELESTKESMKKMEAEQRALNIRIEELIAKYEAKAWEARQAQMAPFLPKTEKLKEEDTVINEYERIREKKVRKTPSENFVEQLKKAYTGEENDIVIDYDFAGNGVDPESVKLFGQDETYKLEMVPASFRVRKIVKNKYRDQDHIYEADNSDDPFPHSPLTPSLAANILNMKYVLGVPFYRYSAYMNQLGFMISEANICHWAKKSAELLDPVYNLLFEELLHNNANVIHIDETPLKVIDEENVKCYMFVYTTSFWDHPVYIYSFSNTRSTKETKDILKDYKGYVICDAYAGYDSLPDMGIKVQRCYVHARRYFADCIKGLPEETVKGTPAYKVITLMSKIFHHEEKFREKKYTAERIQKERNKPYYLKCIDAVDKYIDGIDPKADETLAKAVNYYKNHRSELYTYLESGYVDLHNNLAERTVKPFVLSRKSFMFCKTASGADVTAKLFTIVQTARANGLKSEEYLAYCLANACTKKPEELLPWSASLPENLRIHAKELR